jgi:hypothetical protein
MPIRPSPASPIPVIAYGPCNIPPVVDASQRAERITYRLLDVLAGACYPLLCALCTTAARCGPRATAAAFGGGPAG